MVRHVSAFSTAPITPARCGWRHFLPFWSAGAEMRVAGPGATLGVEVKHRLARAQVCPPAAPRCSAAATAAEQICRTEWQPVLWISKTHDQDT